MGSYDICGDRSARVSCVRAARYRVLHEELETLCPELMWSHVFLAIDYLRRSGQIHVALDVDGTYKMRALHATTVTASSAAPLAV